MARSARTGTLRTTSLPLERVLECKRLAGCKLNDLVLAIISGALREFSRRRGSEPMPLRAMIPINLRGDSDDGRATGNRIGFGFVELPIASADALTRLRSIRRQSAAPARPPTAPSAPTRSCSRSACCPGR